MATATATRSPQAQPADVPYDLTVDLFARVAESGLIPLDRRVDLLDGWPGQSESSSVPRRRGTASEVGKGGGTAR
jgi:hypothetical protein